MDEAAPLTWIIASINAIVTAGAGATANAIATKITPLVTVVFGIYILLISVNYLRGAESEPVLDFGMRCAGFAVIIGMGLAAGQYVALVMPIVTGIGGDLASAVGGGTPTASNLDQLALHYFKILDEGYEAANALFFPANVGPMTLYLMKAALILIGLIPLLVAATLALVVADVGLVIVAMLGPLFFAFLLFPATRQYFSAWVNTIVSYSLIPLIVAVIAGISVGLSAQMLSSGATLDQTSLKSVFYASVGNLLLLFLLGQVSSLASSLSAGGINVASAGGVGSAASAVRGGVSGSAREIKGMGFKPGAPRPSTQNNSIRKAG